MDMLLKEHGFAQLGVTDETSAVKVGKLLAAQKILIGTAMKLGESIIITGRVVDIERGIAERGAKVATKNEDEMIYAITQFIVQLTGRQVTSSYKRDAKPHVVIRTNKQIYAKDKDIIVTFSNFPGTKWDYISIAKKSASAADHYTYQYTSRLKEGAITFYRGVYEPGAHEVRAHTEYYKENRNLQASYVFTVR